MKKCSECKQSKELLKFYKNRSTTDGLSGQCKMCILLQRQTEGGKIVKNRAVRKFRQTTKGKNTHQRSVSKDKLKFPEKVKARNAVTNAIKMGGIKRPPHCEECFQEKFVYGHHPDYDKYLDVDWLCIKCHVELHRKLLLI